LSASTVQVRCWGEQCVAYAISSGNTHLITPLAAQVLAAVKEGYVEQDAMTAHLADTLGIKLDAGKRFRENAFCAELHRGSSLQLTVYREKPVDS